ncbi:MAG: alpha-E domain-containing protein [Eubacteriales bacterium]
MGTFGINKNNRLYWLGRYTERVYQGIENIRIINDKILDNTPVDIADFRRRLGITSTTFSTSEEFCSRYAFDRTMPESLLSTADSMLGNGMVLRDILGTQTLSYIQMAVSALEEASVSQAFDVQLQWVMDDIMAFRGSYAEYIEESEVRNTIRSGASVERVGTLLRLEVEDAIIIKEINKLVARLHRTHLEYDEEKLQIIQQFLSNKEGVLNRFDVLESVESLFRI